MTLTAITREPSPRLEEGEVTYINRSPVSYKSAAWQHATYCDAMRSVGVNVITLPCLDEFPDSVFVEDTAVVLDEVAVLCAMGAKSRRPEAAHMKAELAKYREVVELQAPASIEGGDVLRIGKTLFVGQSTRTNALGAQALAEAIAPYGYGVIPVGVHGALHLKTACTALDDHTVLMNSNWIDPTPFRGFDLVEAAHDEPWAGNILRLDNWIIAQTGFPRTADMIAKRGYNVQLVDMSEYGKVEGSLTCLSLVFRT